MTKVDEAIAELGEAIAINDPELEGLRDFSRLNIESATGVEVLAATAVYERRNTLLKAARDACAALVANGYPVEPLIEVDPAILADLAEQKRTIDAAFGKFASNAAMSLNLAAGAPQPKDT